MPLEEPLKPHDPSRGWLRHETAFFLVLLLGLLAAGKSKMFADPGALWHPTVGERILQVGPFEGDPYSFVPWGEWFTKDWLAEAIFALCLRAAGPDGIQLLCAALLAGFYTWMFRRFRTLGCHPMLATLGTLLAVAGTSFHFFARPLVFTLVCFGFVFAILADFEAGRTSLRKLLWLPPIFAFWANCHPAVFGGVATVWLMVGVWLTQWLLGWGGPVRDRRTAGAVAGFAALSFAATLLNPFGWKLPMMATELMSSPLLQQMIDEHRPLFRRVEMLDLYLAFVGLLFLGFALWHGVKNFGAAGLATAAWLLMTCARVRNGEFLASAFVLYATAQWAKHPIAEALATRPDWFRAPDRWHALPAFGLRAAVLPTLAVALAAGLKCAGVPAPLVGAGWADLASPVAPVETLPALRAYAKLARPGQPIFNDMNFGGFVIHFLPTLKVYCDDRCELLRDAGLRAYDALWRDPRGIETLCDRHAIEVALVAIDQPERPSPFDQYLSKSGRWVEVHRDRVAAVYRRTDVPASAAFMVSPTP